LENPLIAIKRFGRVPAGSAENQWSQMAKFRAQKICHRRLFGREVAHYGRLAPCDGWLRALRARVVGHESIHREYAVHCSTHLDRDRITLMRRIGVDRVIRISEQERGIFCPVVEAGNLVMPFGSAAEAIDVFTIVRIEAQVAEQIVERAIFHHDDENGFNETEIRRHGSR
jgi:hypothetical protein